jgi:hypothetical protein
MSTVPQEIEGIRLAAVCYLAVTRPRLCLPRICLGIPEEETSILAFNHTWKSRHLQDVLL